MSTVFWNRPSEDLCDSDDAISYRGRLIYKESVSIIKKSPEEGDDDSNLVLEVGLEPTKPYGGRFTVSCDCHYTIPAWCGAASRARTEDLRFTKPLL